MANKSYVSLLGGSMKKFIFIVIALVQSTFLFAENQIKIGVNGMVCSFCIQGIEKKFKKLEQLESINVDLNTKLVTLQLKGEETISDETIKNLITEAGYNVTKIERTKK